jgi:triacylglycerol lipase
VHGFGFRDDIILMKYWGRIPSVLSELGTSVYLSNHDAIGSIKTNSEHISRRIDSIKKLESTDKVNIISHSKGGLDCRYLISTLMGSSKIASLTTISTPHRGTYLAEYVLNKVPNLSVGSSTANYFAKLFGDLNPNLLAALDSLTPKETQKFNENNLDSSEVYYQSFSSALFGKILKPILKWSHNLIYDQEGENDGIVSIASSKWRDSHEVVGQDEMKSISHYEIIGQGLKADNTGFNAAKFYQKIISKLIQLNF